MVTNAFWKLLCTGTPKLTLKPFYTDVLDIYHMEERKNVLILRMSLEYRFFETTTLLSTSLFFLKPKIHYSINKIPVLELILSFLNESSDLHKSHFNIILSLRLRLTNGIFLSGLPQTHSVYPDNFMLGILEE